MTNATPEPDEDENFVPDFTKEPADEDYAGDLVYGKPQEFQDAEDDSWQ